ncbi:MAG: tryptophan-rich sensory protein, partial [Gammaproteobacteria bacterium]|nr:tryptophan-rich sensory protein [Gammaproteobacteria bacterium]
ALPINGQQTGEISDRFQVFFTPAGYVFSIWGLIYLGLLGFSIYQLLPSQRRNELIDRISLPFWISCIANIAWILFWHYEYFGTTMAVMLVLLGSLVWLTRILFAEGKPGTSAERWLVRVPFSIYVGWITVATLANLTALLEEKNLRPFDMAAQDFAVAMVVIGGVIALTVGRIRKDLAYLAVIVWAFVGIGVKNGWAGPVAVSAMVVLGAVVIEGVWIMLSRNQMRATGPD